MFKHFFEDIFLLVSEYNYIIIFGVMFLENITGLGLFIPGVLIVIIGGFLAGTGDLNIFYVFLMSFIGTIAGDNLSYNLGRFGLIKLPFLKRFTERFELIEKAIQTSADRFLLFFHFPVFSRMIVPAFLGILQYSLKRWLIFDTIGALIFTSSFTILGYIVGKLFGEVLYAIEISKYIEWFFIIILTLWLISIINSVRKVFKHTK